MQRAAGSAESLTLFVCGDVMTGRGIDQALPHPGSPTLYESWVRDARDYIALAEAASGKFSRPLSLTEIWGDALDELTRFQPDIRLGNLETAITSHDEPWPGKGINYRMHPDNAACLQAAAFDCCALANNHVLDWGVPGLLETGRVLDQLKIAWCGAGGELAAGQRPAVLEPVPGSRVLIWSVGLPDSGIPQAWGAETRQPGVWLLPDASRSSAESVAQHIRAEKRATDLAVVSIHWGSNWGYAVPREDRSFAHHLMDAGADLVHGHSSHHPRGMELYRGRPILYGCGDFINDYEGIRGHESYRPELSLMYFLRYPSSGGPLLDLWLTPAAHRPLRPATGRRSGCPVAARCHEAGVQRPDGRSGVGCARPHPLDRTCAQGERRVLSK